MDTVISNQTDNSVMEACWTLIKSLNRRMQIVLATRLEQYIQADNLKKAEAKDFAEAMAYIKSLSAAKPNTVPSDVRGIESLINEKYGD